MKLGMTLMCAITAFSTFAASGAQAREWGEPGVPRPKPKCPPPRECLEFVWNSHDWTCEPKHRSNGTPCETYVSELGITDSGSCQSGRCVVNYDGNINPKYIVSSVIYAPPGNNGSNVSTLTYNSGESFGQTLSISDSFTDNLDISSKTSLGFGTGIDITMNYSNEWQNSNSSEQDFSMSFNESKVFIGAGYVGVDHDYDQIYIFLNPTIRTRINNYGKLGWALGSRDSELMFDLPIYAGEMTGEFNWDENTKALLDSRGFDSSDYETILSANPFADGSTAIDGSRFRPAYEQLGNGFGGGVYPYRPAQDDNYPIVQTVNITKAASQKASHTNSHKYSVSISISGGYKFSTLLTSTLSVSNKMTFSNSNTKSVRGSSTSGVTLKFPSPPKGYNGPLFLAAYVDTVYKTYLFQTVNPPSYQSMSQPLESSYFDDDDISDQKPNLPDRNMK